MPTPRKYNEPMSEAILVRLMPEQKAQLEKVAEKLNKVLTDMVRDWIFEKLDKEKELGG